MLRLDELQFADGNFFVAMEYYAAIMNRTYMVLIAADNIVGIIVHGVVASTDRGDWLTRLIAAKLSPNGDLSNPMSYVDEKYGRLYKDVDLCSDDLTRIKKANFRVALSDIKNVYYDPTKKWGMGAYPHDGKVYIEFGGCEREFIVLGDQSGEAIASAIRNRLPSALA